MLLTRLVRKFNHWIKTMSHKILVSGATGFIASHTIEKLLAQGHDVDATVRNAAEHLSLVSAELTAKDPFDAHVDVDIIMHMASPYVMHAKDPQRDLVDPAVEGTLSMLRAAAKSPRVKRVVLTSSMAAITDEPDGRVLTEADWNSKSSLTRNPYYLSKAAAERAAWDFMTAEKPGFNLVVINPSLVVGPAHTPAINTSNQTFVDMINGVYPAVMAIDWGFVDVRDVADAHIAAMNTPAASGRYICASANMTMAEVADLMRAKGYSHTKLPKLDLSGGFGTALMRLASHFQPVGIGSYLRTHLGRAPRFDNSKIRKELGITFRAPADSISDTLADLAKWGHIPAQKA
jgi:dihydroflavonol-4-reductase